MTNSRTTKADGPKRLYKVSLEHIQHGREYGETLYLRATPQQLESYARRELRELSVLDVEITWSLKRQWATTDDRAAHGLTRTLIVSAEEIQDLPRVEFMEL